MLEEHGGPAVAGRTRDRRRLLRRAPVSDQGVPGAGDQAGGRYPHHPDREPGASGETDRWASECGSCATDINGLAQAYASLQEDVERKIGEANSRLEAEKNRLAALMSDLTQGVLVCNSEGRILLYNARAKQLLDEPSRNGRSIGGALVGLGRSIFAIMDKNLIVHALDTIRHKLDEGSARSVGSSGHRAQPRPAGARERGRRYLTASATSTASSSRWTTSRGPSRSTVAAMPCCARLPKARAPRWPTSGRRSRRCSSTRR